MEGAFSVAVSGSKNPDGKADRWWTPTVITKAESEGVRLAVTERQEMNVVIPEVQAANGVEGDFIMCEVEEQLAARGEVQGPNRREVIRVESGETQDYVRERWAHDDLPSASSELRGPYTGVTTDGKR